jgi:transposase
MSSSNDTPRFVALDLHKRYVMVGAVNAHQEVVLRPQRVELVAFEAWAKKHLRPTDEVVLEATSNAWYIYDLLEPLVTGVVVANPYHVKLIAASLVKTDRRDTLVLARLLAANLIPEIWIPPVEVRELRALIAHRERLVSQQTATTQSWRTAPGKTGCKGCCIATKSCPLLASSSVKPTGPGGLN